MDPLVLQRSAYVAAALAVGVLLGVAATLGWRWYRLYRERQRRRQRIEGIAVGYLRDVAIPDGGGGYLHVDYLLLTPRGLLVLEVRDMAGNVFGSDAMIEWTVMQAGRRHTFANPQNGLYDRLAALKSLAGEVPVDGRIVFGAAAVFPKGLPRLTLREVALDAEFPLGERSIAVQLAAPWLPVWERLREQLPRSEFSTRT